MNPTTTLGQRIRQLRQERRLTQRQVADAADIDVTYLSKIENGRLEHTPSVKTLLDLAGALAVDELELMSLANKVPTVLESIADSKEAVRFFRHVSETVRSPAEWRELLAYLRPSSRTAMVTGSPFASGDQVIYEPNGATGIVVGPTPGGSPEFIRIVLDNQVVTARVEELIPKRDQVAELVSRLCEGTSTDATGVRLLLTLLRLSRPLSGTLYSYGASRTIFSPHQFKPLLKILSAPSPRILVADEVGVGKTIEAALILQELQARHFFLPNEVNMIVCPSALTDKWRDELQSRFSLDATVLDSVSLRSWVRRLEDSGRLAYGDLLTVGSLQGLRSEEQRTQLTRAFELGLRIGLVVVDEAHHARNAGTETYALVEMLAAEARAVVFLSATPLHLGDRDLFNLFHLLDPDLFPNLAAFSSLLEPIRVLNRAIRVLEIQGVEGREVARQELSRLNSADESRLVLGDPRWPKAARMLADENEWSIERATAARDLLTEISPLAHSFTRTRKRDVIVPAPIRDAQPILVEFTPDQARFYQDATQLLIEAKMGDGMGSATPFLQVMLQRRMSSCLPAFIKSLSAANASGYFGDFEPESEQDDRVEELPEDRVESLSLSSTVATGRDLLARAGQLQNGADPKLDALLQVLTEVVSERGHQCIVFAFFIGTLEYLEAKLRASSYRVGIIHGKIHPRDDRSDQPSRKTVIEQFWRGEIDVLLSSEVGGEGLDFQCANVIINYDLPWNPMRIEQRIGRVDRFGQKADKILVYNLLIHGTIEERILNRLYERLNVFHETVGPLEPVLGDGPRSWEKLAVRLYLSEEEMQEAIRRVDAARWRRQEDLQRFEVLRNELAMDDVFTEKVIRARNEGDMIEPADLRDLYSAAFVAAFPESSLVEREDGRVEIQVGRDLRTSIGRRLAPTDANRIDPRQMLAFRRAFSPLLTKSAVVGTFDASSAQQGEQVEIFSAIHPLSNLLAGALIAPEVVPAARVSLPDITAIHVIGLYLLDIRGGQVSTRLLPAAVGKFNGAWTPLNEAESADLLRAACHHGYPTEEAVSQADAAGALAAVDAAILPIRVRLETDLGERAETTVDQRLRSHDTMVLKQKERLTALVSRLRQEGKNKGARLNEQNLQAFLRRQETVRIEIDQARHLSMLHSLAGLIWISPK
jgi:superfamily II DNA or RNA helicase/transcriptional regulator with XRE-family HTH domain